MSARDDYPLLNNATASVAFDEQTQEALSEIDRLRTELDDTKRRWMERDNAAALAQIQADSFAAQYLLLARERDVLHDRVRFLEVELGVEP